MIRPEIAWRGQTLGGDSPFRIQSIDGWEDLPPGRSSDEPRSRSHGEHRGQYLAGGRTVTVKGVIVDPGLAAGSVLALQAATPFMADTLDELTITMYGRTLTAFARVERRNLPQDLGYGVGVSSWALQWHAPDPLRYGPLQAPMSTGLPTAGGGVTYPLGPTWTYGDPGDPGRITLTNPGTAPAPIFMEVTGGLPFGFEVSAAGQRDVYPVEVPAGQVVSIDTGTGAVLAEGTADRRTNLTVADWPHVPPGSSLTLQFASLGGAFDPAARLAVPAPRGAYW